MSRGGATYYFAWDQVGTLRAVYNASGALVKRVESDSFGNILTDTAPTFTVPFGSAGGLRDTDTGLVHFGYRDYDPATGRWTAKDPIGFNGGDVNLYGYVEDDPVNLVDPMGLMGITAPIPFPTGYPVDPNIPSTESYPGQQMPPLQEGFPAGQQPPLTESYPGQQQPPLQEGYPVPPDQGPGSGMVCSTEHTKGARGSTKNDHELGRSRNNIDTNRGEKGDKNRPLPRKRPEGKKGPWPPEGKSTW
ncbi:MAG: hypothetical protein HGA80_08125 [Candidatus Omnitrophica bacterium]|nr:hypothetical protein [Candidatus Omnitrophota bacterium]